MQTLLDVIAGLIAGLFVITTIAVTFGGWWIGY